ncbi:DnaB-like helicase [Maribacter phage Molly_5]|uniref:DnaB-like helicase n=2 Tax=Mollyvirus TaxID=2948826 RepID=A0A8E4UXT5_9CAUD|nr:DnaB-like helicase [Maribacter phage Molly_1]YP_010357359.1 DnaB-like helicase [Maribacter phage Colly_1]QQO97603.1 DnaB-like helicase [Maribacter phage Molly_2]QQO97803.1 DnaB-like helicase [Maribacter phage Molly_3]QQO98004.1 DnaB-like helicase [Maribacter phage Molly_4]QQO98204.1 DnaB-like helicase [Maribacter phage Molly_5]QQO97208.1 DnaB-like helicase [Maribacter phage Colly_1]
MSEPTKFQFDADYQLEILAMIVRDPVFLAMNQDLVKPNYFTNIYFSTIYEFIKVFYTKYANSPNLQQMKVLVTEECRERKLSEDVKLEIFNYVNIIFNREIIDHNFIKDSVITFCRQQEFRKATEQAYNILNQPKEDRQALDKISSLWLDTINKGFGDDIGINLTTMPNNYRKLLEAEYSEARRIRSAIPAVNKWMDGGWSRGGLYAFLAPPERGKSTVLAAEAAGQVRMGKIVNVYTMELSEFAFMMKVVQNLVNLTSKEILSSSDGVVKERLEYWAKFRSNINIKYYNRDSISVNTIRAHHSKVDHLQADKTDITLIDYADHLMPTKFTNNMYQDKGQIYTDLRSYAYDYDIPVITASQPKIDGHDGDEVDIIKMHHLEGSSQKQHILDGLISINQTTAERNMDPPRIRLYNAKIRSGEAKKYAAPYILDYAKAQLIEVKYENNDD